VEGKPLPVTISRNPPVASAALNALRDAAWDQVGDQDWGRSSDTA